MREEDSTISRGTLEGWFCEASTFETDAACDTEALAQSIWAIVQARRTNEERDGTEGADLLLSYGPSTDGSATPTLKAFVVPRTLVWYEKYQKWLPRTTSLGGFGALHLSGLLAQGTKETDYEALRAVAGTEDAKSRLRAAYKKATC